MAAFLLLTVNAVSLPPVLCLPSPCTSLFSFLLLPLPSFGAGLQMSGFPKVSSLALLECTLLLLPVVTVFLGLALELLTSQFNNLKY